MSTIDTIKLDLISGMKNGFKDRRKFPNIIGFNKNLIEIKEIKGEFKVVSNHPSADRLAVQLSDVDNIAEIINSGNNLNIKKNLAGKYVVDFIMDREEQPAPRIVLVEYYKVSSHLGNYGAGRTIKTFSLLPGEKTKISTKTYKKSESSRKESSSILDSFTDESSEEFEDALSGENSDTVNIAKNSSYNVEASVKASMGVASADVSGGVSGETNASREQFAKKITNAVEKQATKASSKRDVNIDTEFEVKQESTDETSVVREIENINVSRTLNFVFRQMNQGYVTTATLMDIRIGFFNGFAESKHEVPLYKIDELVERYVNEDYRDMVKYNILASLKIIKDYNDKIVKNFIKRNILKEIPSGDEIEFNQKMQEFDDALIELSLSDGDPQPIIDKLNSCEDIIRRICGPTYWSVNKQCTTDYVDDASSTQITTTGIITSVSKNIIRTDGVIVDAILGHGEALDDYSQGLQNNAVRERKLDNQLKDVEVDKSRFAMKIVESKDEVQAQLFETVFPKPVEKEQEEE